MKKVLILLVICALAAPVFADGTVTISKQDNGADVDIILTVDTADAGDGPVGFALDVTATDPDKDLTDTVVVDSFFDIFIDLAFDEENGDGYLYAEGSNPVCKVGAAGQISTAGSAASVATAMAGDRVYAVCAGGLGGETGTPADPPTGAITLLKISGEAGATATITENEIRGGIVFKMGGTVTVNGLPLDITIPDDECYAGQPDYAEWVAVGKPDSWCNRYQCRGDVDGQIEVIGTLPFPPYEAYGPVGPADLALFLAAYKVEGAANIDADLNHAEDVVGTLPFPPYEVYGRTGAGDLAIFLANYKVETASVTPCGNPELP